MQVKDILNAHNRIDATDILEYLGFEKQQLFQNQQVVLTNEQEKQYENILQKLNEDYPIQYLLQKTEFYGREFLVKENVLIPRFDTEYLVDAVISHVPYQKVLEIGTGTGIIGITLALEKKDTHVDAVDINSDCVQLATRNAKKWNADVRVFSSDLFSAVNDTYDLIISNPPYISAEDMEKLDRKVNYEPENALYGGKDGLDFYRRIIQQAPPFLTDEGYLAFEIGYDQMDRVCELLEHSFDILHRIKDLSGFDRVIISRRKKWKI